jgi:hypothetical protein
MRHIPKASKRKFRAIRPGDAAMPAFPMPAFRLPATLGLVAILSVCGMGVIATGADATPTALRVAAAATVRVAPRYNVAEVRVSVPAKLRVSEANRFFPVADIVWRGEPPGERHAQVRAIFEQAMKAGTAQMRSGPKVVVDIEVVRFHCLTEKTRYTVGGFHSLHFILTVRDAATGTIIEGPRRVEADVKASGGARAIAEDEAGRTQRVVVVEALTRAILRELSTPVLASGS